MIGHLELQTVAISRSRFVRAFSREAGFELEREHQHFLADVPVRFGDTLEIYWDGEWISGCYEWTRDPHDEPVLRTHDRVLSLSPGELLRWPDLALGQLTWHYRLASSDL